MKNIIIVGPSRAGKSTLSKRISEELDYFVISIDKLVATFGRAYPQLDVRLNWNRAKTIENIAPFLGHFLGVFSTDHHSFADNQNLRTPAIEGNRFVLEGAYFDFEQIALILKQYGIEEMKDNFVLIGLVQNNKTAEEFAADLETYDTEDDWTYGFNHEDRIWVAQDKLAYSRSMTADLEKYGFTIYDTSAERELVFDKIIADIKSKLV